MKSISLLVITFLLFSNSAFATDFLSRTAACRLEVKILGPDLLEEDIDCIWLEKHKAQVVEECKECLADLELIKEASKGYFDY